MRTFATILCLLTVPALAGAQDLEAVGLPGGDRIEPPATSEAEASFVAASMPMALERVPRAERDGLPAAIASAYRRLHDRAGPQPSVWATSVTGGSPSALLAQGTGETAVIFLHGYGGNFTWPCALMAEAAAALEASTLCPSLDSGARWSRGEGPRIVDESIALMRRRGARRVILAGLSSGGVGASRLARRLGGRIDGLILLSGVDGTARARQPALVIHGTRDHMVATGAARRFVRRHQRATLTLLEGGHFVLADHQGEVARSITSWLRERVP